MLYTKELTVKYDVDVLVVGGGAAGVAAAVSADSGDIRSISVKELRERLIADGALI